MEKRVAQSAWRWVLISLNIIALVLSTTLSWHYIAGGKMVGCSGGSACDQVLNSRWSMLGPFPVSGLAVGAYLALLVSLFVVTAADHSIRRLAWGLMLFLTGSIIGSAIWFAILQKWIIKQFCVYCMSTHAVGTLLALMVIGRSLQERVAHVRLLSPLRSLILLLVGLLSAGGMAAYQLNDTPSESGHDDALETMLPAASKYEEVPMVGSPDAPHIVTMLFDYQCSHCQKLHFMLNEVVRKYDGKLAFNLCPTPLNSSCNPYIPEEKGGFIDSCELARLGLAVWLADHDAFHAFEIFMFTFDSGSSWHPRTLDAATAKAVELVGQKQLDAALADPWIEEYLQTCIQIFGKTLKNERGAVPKMIYENKWVVPEPFNADELVTILQKTLGIPKP